MNALSTIQGPSARATPTEGASQAKPAERAYDSLTVEILRRHVRRPLVMFMPAGRELLSGAV
ncbi:hypothetical protein DDK22_36300 [Cupriavidus necator]|uniref:Uncharacterized protein n=1 Tax=Cupriavidus necator TaxID=106590 RepID=A0A367P8Q8_CUPNE|nr:hypothetical protein DDK22_36300 [Cupriavidus necator]